MRSTNTVWLLLVSLVGICCPAFAQELPEEPYPAVTHLVGHEDAELLQRVQDVIDDWDPRKLVNPYVITTKAEGPDGKQIVRKSLRRPDLLEFIADVDAAEALGKAFFWEMRAGSDFRRTADGTYVGTACATCHYRYGIDTRDRHTERIPFVAWDQYKLHEKHLLNFGESQSPYDPVVSATQVLRWKGKTPFSLIVGSQGVERKMFVGLNPPATTAGEWFSESSNAMKGDRSVDNGLMKKEWQMFYEGHDPKGKAFRQITARNSPTIINKGFADRLFHDGRAQSTFNGFSIFGDFQKKFEGKDVIHRRNSEGDEPIPVRIAILKAALASQAVGPIVNEVEMSYEGRTFVDVARKLLKARILEHQTVSASDDVLNRFADYIGPNGKTYEELIKRAFRREWWDNYGQKDVTLALSKVDGEKGPLIEANFPLFWGLAILIYESELVTNQSPFDAMMQGDPKPVNERWKSVRKEIEPIYLDRAQTDNPKPSGSPQPKHKTGTAVFQHGLRVFMNRGCIECHNGPLFSEIYDRIPDVEGRIPIAQDLHRTLLPLAKSDSLAQHARVFHQRVLDSVAEIVATAKPSLSARAPSIANALDVLRNDARGNEQILAGLVFQHVEALGLKPTDAIEIAKLLKRYEREVVTKLGGRKYFSENARVALASKIVERVMVEDMPIPNGQVPTRPVLPIKGPLADRAYAFYDLGFYNLGVSPPRYDRGIGAALYTGSDPHQLAVALKLVRERMQNSTDQKQRSIARILSKSPSYKVAMELLPTGADRELDSAQRAILRKAVSRELEELDSIQQSSSGVSGSAYRFKRSETQRRGQLEDAAKALGDAKPQGVVPLAVALATSKEIDQSWDRNTINDESGADSRRRSDYHFASRARELVQNEEPWGLRKPLLHDNELSFWGAFQTPTLRNVELTGPYMHNGRLIDLCDVIDFYDDGGHIPRHREWNPDKHPEIVKLHMTGDDKLAMLFFLYCLTDEHVRNECGPFSHPSINLVNGYQVALPTPLENILNVSASP